MNQDAHATGTDAPASPGSEMQDVLNSIESLLDPPQDEQGDDEAQPDQEAEGEDADAEGSEEQGAEDEESKDPEADEEQEAPPAPAARKFTVKVDGKDHQVDEAELVAGYSRQSDYTRKTQSLANDRKAFEQEQVQTRQERAEYQALLPQLRKAIEGGMGAEPNWAELQANDQKNGTSTFANEYAKWQMRKQSVMSLRAEEQRVAQRQQAEQQALTEKHLARERELLLNVLPGWKDPKVAKQESQEIADVMRSVGYADNDIAIYDHRALALARKAAKFDAIMSGRQKLREKADKAPVVKPGGGKSSVATNAAQAASKRLSQTGSVKDAAALLEKFL